MYFTLQSDSAHVKLEDLASDQSFNVKVGRVNAMRQYRVLPEIVVRTLPSMAYRPHKIPRQSISVSNFYTNENLSSLSAYVVWEPADGMRLCNSFPIAFSSNKFDYIYTVFFSRYGMLLSHVFGWNR